MLREIANVKQLKNEPRRRWFSSSTLDLFIWYDDDDAIIQFQICYDKGTAERALTWHFEKGLLHHSVDDGEGRTFRMKSSPILVSDGEFDTDNIISKFREIAGDIDYSTVEFILDNIQSATRS